MERTRCPVCSQNALYKDHKVFRCENCGAVIPAMALTDYSKVTPRMRARYFEATGMYSDDKEILEWSIENEQKQ